MPTDITEVETFTARIYVSLREGYDGQTHLIDEVYSACAMYVDLHPMCVTVTPTRFIHSSGQEEGVEVGLINYPRFPTVGEDIVAAAVSLARCLKNKFKQHRVTVVTTDKTYMVGDK